MTPVGFMLLFLTGVGPLLAWRKSTLVEPAARSSLWPVRRGAGGIGGATCALGMPFWASGLCFALCALGRDHDPAGVHARRARAPRARRARILFTALVGLFARSRRRYAGYIVHLGIVLMFLGFAGDGFERDETRAR